MTKKDTKKVIDEVLTKINTESPIKRTIECIEPKSIAFIYMIFKGKKYETRKDFSTDIEMILREVIDIANTIGFIKIIYDFILIVLNMY